MATWTLRKLLRFPVAATRPILAEGSVGIAQDTRQLGICDGMQWKAYCDMLVFEGDQDYAPTATNRQVKAGWLIYKMAPTSDRTIDLSSTAWNEGAKVTVINRSTGGSDLLVSLGSVTHVVNPGETWEATYFGGSWIVPSTLNGMRNKLINGDMRIGQRNDGSSKTYTAGAGRAYGVDRWWVQCTGANMTGQRVAGSMSPYAYRLNGAINVTDVQFGQIIEAENAAPLKNRIVTVSAILRADQQRTITWRAKRAGAADNWTSPVQLATGTIAVTTVPKRFTFSFAAGSSSDLGIGIQFETGSFGSGAFLEIEEVQLEEGPVATPFERRLVGAELALCMRYYEKWVADSAYAYIGVAASYSSGSAILLYQYKQAKRIPTSLAAWSGAIQSDINPQPSGLSAPAGRSNKFYSPIIVSATGYTPGYAYTITSANRTDTTLEFDAEF